MKRHIEIERSNFPEESSESDSEFNEELDPEIVKVIDELYLKDIDRKFRTGKEDDGSRFGLKEYFQETQVALKRFEENNKNYPEDVQLGKVYFSCVLVTEASCLRLRNEAKKKSKENLALREAKWCLDLASYYWTFKEDPEAACIVKMCMDRFQKTREMLGYTPRDIQGMLRGFKGLLGLMNALDKNGQELRLPTPKQDAEDKIDLFSKSSNGDYIAWQIKTVANQGEVFTEEIDMHNIDPKMRKLVNSTQKLERESGLTITPICITIPEHYIGDDFEPGSALNRDIDKQYKDMGVDNHE